MRAKSIAVFLSVLVALVTLCVVQVDYSLYNEQVAQGEALARGQMAALVPSILSESQRLVDTHKALLAEPLEKETDFTESLTNRIELMAHLTAQESGDWAFGKKTFFDKTTTKAWAENYILLALKALKPSDVVQGGISMLALFDPQRSVYFLWLVRDSETEWTAFLTKPEVFQSLMDRLKGQSTSVLIFNRQGQVLGHTTAEYLGTLMTEDPMVSEVIKAGKKSGVKNFKDANGENAQGFYEQVPYSNVFVAAVRPLRGAEKTRQNLRWQILLLGAGLALVGVAVLYLISKPGGSAIRQTPNLESQMSPVSSTAANLSSTSNAPTLSLQTKTEMAKEKIKAYAESANAVARELHGPFNKILAHAQSLKSQGGADASTVERIESLARNGRDTILKLLSFSGEEEYRIEPTSLVESINLALVEMEPILKADNIQLEKDLKRMPEVPANHQAVKRVVTEVLKNSREALLKAAHKKISIATEVQDPFIVIKVSDSGEGISPPNMGHIFDPYFTTKGSATHAGLGLSVVQGSMREFGGDVKVRSGSEGGTVVELRFPASPSSVQYKSQDFTLSANSLPVPPAKINPPATGKMQAPMKPLSDPHPLMPPAPSEIMDIFEPPTLENTQSALQNVAAAALSIPPLAKAMPAAKQTAMPAAKPMSAPLPSKVDSKINSPQFEVKKKDSRLDLSSLAVRRPGDKK